MASPCPNPKVHHQTARAARTEAQTMADMARTPFNVFPCRFCSEWVIGRPATEAELGPQTVYPHGLLPGYLSAQARCVQPQPKPRPTPALAQATPKVSPPGQGSSKTHREQRRRARRKAEKRARVQAEAAGQEAG